jgi:hypothetical protein
MCSFLKRCEAADGLDLLKLSEAIQDCGCAGASAWSFVEALINERCNARADASHG